MTNPEIVLRAMFYVKQPTNVLRVQYNELRGAPAPTPCRLPRDAVINYLLMTEFGEDAVLSNCDHINSQVQLSSAQRAILHRLPVAPE